MHPYFYRRLSQCLAAEASNTDIALPASRAVGLLAAPACKMFSTGATAVAHRALAVRLAFGPRLTSAQARTISIMETYDIEHAQSRGPGQVLPFRRRKP